MFEPTGRSWRSSWNGLIWPSFRRLERRTRGRRPHVPSSKSRCQRATKTDAPSNPFFSGRPVRLVFGDRRAVPCGPSLRWRGIYGGCSEPSTPFWN